MRILQNRRRGRRRRGGTGAGRAPSPSPTRTSDIIIGLCKSRALCENEIPASRKNENIRGFPQSEVAVVSGADFPRQLVKTLKFYIIFIANYSALEGLERDRETIFQRIRQRQGCEEKQALCLYTVGRRRSKLFTKSLSCRHYS